jgi:hypothetical protein
MDSDLDIFEWDDETKEITGLKSPLIGGSVEIIWRDRVGRTIDRHKIVSQMPEEVGEPE